MTIGYIFLFLLLIYIIICIVIFFTQRSLMYHPSENNYLDENKLNHKIEKIKISSDNELNSWLVCEDNINLILLISLANIHQKMRIYFFII